MKLSAPGSLANTIVLPCSICSLAMTFGSSLGTERWIARSGSSGNATFRALAIFMDAPEYARPPACRAAGRMTSQQVLPISLWCR